MEWSGDSDDYDDEKTDDLSEDITDDCTDSCEIPQISQSDDDWSEGKVENGLIGKTESRLQKVNRLARLVPYRDELDQVRLELWDNLRNNLCEAIATQGQALLDWIRACDQYVVTFGLAFTKREHVLLVQMCYQTLVSIEYDFRVIRRLIILLTKLLRKAALLSRNDLQLDWRPLYRLYHQLSESAHIRKQTVFYEPEILAEMITLVTRARVYFPKEATEQMLSEWRQFLCVYSTKFDQHLYLFMLFLPTMLPPEEHVFGFKLWFEDFINLWLERPNQDPDSHLFFIRIFSGLAKDSVGYIDWSPYIPVILHRIKKRFDTSYATISNLEMTLCAQWITYMIAPGQSSLQISALVQYFKFKFAKHKNLSCHLLDELIRRLRAERKQSRKPWFDHTPQSHLLTDEIVTEFATFISAQFERITFSDFEMESLHNLSLICSEEMTNQMIDKFDFAEERIFEPNRLKLALGMFIASLYPMITNEQHGRQHCIHVIPILSKLIQSINTNDQTLCFLHLLAIRSILVLGMPLQDCSHFVKNKKSQNTTNQEHKYNRQILKDSLQLEQFPQEFLQLSFTIIESNNVDLLTMTCKSLSLKEMIFEILVCIFSVIPEDKFKKLSDQLLKYCTKSINDNVECCGVMEKMIDACLLTDTTGAVFDKLFRAVSSNLISSIDGQQKYSDICQSEFIYNWRLLQTTVSVNGQMLLPYRVKIVELLKTIYRIDFEDNFKHNHLISDVLSVLFYKLTSHYLVDYGFDSCANKKDHDFAFNRLMNFPHLCKLEQLSLNWHIPSGEEIEFAKQLFQEFIKPEMCSLQQWTDAQLELTSAQVEKSLGIVLSFLGCVQCLPIDGDSIHEQKYFNLRDIFAIDLFDGENFRFNLILLAGKIFERLKSTTSDNVNLIEMIIEIVEFCLFAFNNASTTKSGFNAFNKTLIKKDDSSLPIVLSFKVSQYQMDISTTLKKWTNLKFTSIHTVAMELLLELSTCGSSKIRFEAQRVLLDVLDTFPWSYSLFVPKLLDNLKNYNREYDAFKGTLFLMYGSRHESILLNHDWAMLLQLWPALVKVNYAEKPEIADLFDNGLLSLFTDHYFTVPIENNLLAVKCANLFNKARGENFVVPSNEEIVRIERSIEQSNTKNRELYLQLIRRLVSILNCHHLHWRFFNLGFTQLSLLIRYDTMVPREAIELFLDNLVHDSIQIRTAAVIGVKKILFLLKPRRELCMNHCATESFDSLELDCLCDRHRFESTIFYDKPHDGYHDNVPKICIKSHVDREQDYSEYQFIANKFRDETFLDRFFYLHSVEHLVTIEVDRVKMFKHLYQIFQLFNLELIFPRIEKLLDKNRQNCDKLAMEILSGLVRASPWLDFNDLSEIKHYLITRIFDKYLMRFNKDSYDYWNYLFEILFHKRDIRRCLWVFEYFFNENQNPITASSCGPYFQASFLNFSSNALVNNWKFTTVSEKVMSELEKHLCHEYKFIRSSVAYMLCIIFHHRIGTGSNAHCSMSHVAAKPNCACFIERIKTKLDQSLLALFTTMNNDASANMSSIKSDIFDCDKDEGKQLCNFLDTISSWVVRCSNSKNVLGAFGFAKLLSYLLVAQTNNEALQENIKRAITGIAEQIYRPTEIDFILTDIDKLCNNWNWHTREEACVFLHNFVCHNLFVLMQNPQWTDSLVHLVLRLLRDEVIEVRVTTRTTLRDFIKWDIVDDRGKRAMIEQFKLNSLPSGNNNNNLVMRHSAVLGLCAFVYAYPSEVPDILPDIVLYLAKRVSDPQPIQKTVTTTLRWFRKSHEPYWAEHKNKFTEQQLVELSNVLISSSCFT